MTDLEPNAFDLDAARALLASAFAPWVRALALEPLALGDLEARLRLPENAALARDNGVVCGQAVAAAADTAAVVALCRANGRYRACTTTDLTTRFLRALPVGPIDIVATITSNGRRLASARIDFLAAGAGAGAGKLGASATCGFLYLDA